MTTQLYTTLISHATTTTFRAWGKDFSDALTAAGFIKSADTGQIDWTTVTIPGTNTAAGYEIRYLNDSLHGTVPIYVKLEYGTGSVADRPSMWITIGRGSNGSGTITTSIVARRQISVTGALPSTSTPYPTYICMVDGFIGAALKVTSNTSQSSYGFFSISRTVDSSGAITADGVVVVAMNSNVLDATTYNLTTSFTIAANAAFVMVPYAMTATLVSGGAQVFPHVCALPEVRTIVGSVTALTGEIGGGTQFQATPVGVTQRNYIQLGGVSGSISGSATHGVCILWE